MGKYDGKTALITGGTSGMGLATARHLLGEGVRVMVTGRAAKTLDAARAELGDRAIVVSSDTSSLGDIDLLAARVQESFGKLDFLFVNAGIAKFAPLEAVTEALWDEMLAINTKGALFTVQKLAPLMPEGSAVVLNTSVVDEKGMHSTTVYAASKAALRSLARTLASELISRGIRVNALSPGPITTPIFEKLGLPKDVAEGMAASMREQNPMKRFGRVDEIARAAAFLAFEATFTTGAELPVDGGLSQL